MRGTLRSSWLIRATGLVAAALLTAGCASAQPKQTFHPQGVSSTQPASTPAASGNTRSDGVTMPPFGKNLHVVMPTWQPTGHGQLAAVTADKNFLLAMLYSQYRGGRDHRWKAYVARPIRPDIGKELSVRSVTTESFTGTIRYSHLSAFADPALKGDIDVAQCFDNSQSTNTNLRSGKALPDTTPANQHFYRTTIVMGQSADGTWRVVSIYPAIFYPRARECKP
ncbi:MAG: hypothetical protein J2P32_02025 [Actinobacteria bacterium]|nr:hypothetical protein [Actinomycetota bacterium]